MTTHLGEIFTRREIDGGVVGMQKWARGTSLTSALTEEFTRDVFGIYHNIILSESPTHEMAEKGICVLLWFGGLRAISKAGGRARWPFWWMGCRGPGPGPEGTRMGEGGQARSGEVVCGAEAGREIIVGRGKKGEEGQKSTEWIGNN